MKKRAMLSICYPKMMVQFCYSRLYLGTETVSCGLLLRKANLVPGRVISLRDPGIEVDRYQGWTWIENLKKTGPTSASMPARMPAQISKTIILWQEPINWNEQLPRMYSCHGVFTDQFIF